MYPLLPPMQGETDKDHGWMGYTTAVKKIYHFDMLLPIFKSRCQETNREKRQRGLPGKQRHADMWQIH